jgi:hypothetical protein
MHCIAETVLPDGGFRYKVASGLQGAITPDMSGVLRAIPQLSADQEFGAGIVNWYSGTDYLLGSSHVRQPSTA